MAKARMEIAHEIRLAKEAEAEMEMHAAKATKMTLEQMAKETPTTSHIKAPLSIKSIDDPSYN